MIVWIPPPGERLADRLGPARDEGHDVGRDEVLFVDEPLDQAQLVSRLERQIDEERQRPRWWRDVRSSGSSPR